MASGTKSRLGVGTWLTLHLIVEILHSWPVGVSHWDPSKQSENASFGENRHVKGKFLRILLLRFNSGHWLTFLTKFHANLSRYKEKRLLVLPVTKASTFRRHFTPLWPRAPKINTIWVWPTYACNILSGSVKVCMPELFAKRRSWVNTYYAVMK